MLNEMKSRNAGNKADIGLVGLAVMGENLVLNMESHGFTVAVYNRTVSKVDNFINGRGKGKNIIGTHSIEKLTANLKSPRKIMLMVKAGKPVDDFIELIIPHLEKGDIKRNQCPQELCKSSCSAEFPPEAADYGLSCSSNLICCIQVPQ